MFRTEWTEYEQALARFCNAYGAFYAYANKKWKKASKVRELSEKLSRSKDVLLKQKQLVGLTGGLAFLDNAYFDGFEIKNGEVQGDLVKAYQWADTWSQKYLNGEEKSEIFLEIAFLLFSLIPYERYCRAWQKAQMM